MKQQEIKQKYDSTADIYDARYKEIQFEKFKLMLADLSFKEIILDHGCGTGLLAEFLKTQTQFEFNNSNGPSRTSSARLFGIDLSFEMLKKAKQRGEVVVQGDLEHLPFKDKTFDTVLSFTSLQNTKYPEQALDELKRISKEQIILTYLNKFDFSKAQADRSAGPHQTREGLIREIEKRFDVQEIRQAGEDIGFVLHK